jgi:hypothetical protein
MKKFDIKWIATALFIFGGTSCALKLPFIKFAFPCFVIAHGIHIYDFLRTHRNKALLFQNAYFFIINSIATYIWFLG